MRTDQVAGVAPLEVLLDRTEGEDVALPEGLERAYGRFVLPRAADRPHVVSNFVETLDGVVSLGVSGQSGGGPISGSNQHDRLVMGLLRAVADAVVVGAGTLRSVPKHIWTAEYAYPPLANEFGELRKRLGTERYPLNGIVTGSGDLTGEFAVLRQSEVPVHVLTTAAGNERLGRGSRKFEAHVLAEDGPIAAKDIVRALFDLGATRLVVLEAGPQLMGKFLEERAVDELFLTVAPQVAGRDDPAKRPGMVSGRSFAPEDPRWASLASLRRWEDHLFLRYAFAPQEG
jgi:riboflavin biosynthesis pyrimidine reductase